MCVCPSLCVSLCLSLSLRLCVSLCVSVCVPLSGLLHRYVPHQVERLIELYKGGAAFAEKLNTFFDGDHYNHGESGQCLSSVRTVQ